MELSGLRVVLADTRFPENVGMAVRACVNMGCSELVLVSPERWIPEKAVPLATPKGLALLGRVRVCGTLLEALGDCRCTIAATARTGGWRREILTPAQAAARAAATGLAGARTALVFGSEDRGLENSQIELCQHIVTIPTAGEASSLNLAQAVLILLYECAAAFREAAKGRAEKQAEIFSVPPDAVPAGDMERFYGLLEKALLRLDVLHGGNPDYFFLPWRRFFARAGLRRHEYDAFMGLCRQVLSRLGEKRGS